MHFHFSHEFWYQKTGSIDNATTESAQNNAALCVFALLPVFFKKRGGGTKNAAGIQKTRQGYKNAVGAKNAAE